MISNYKNRLSLLGLAVLTIAAVFASAPHYRGAPPGEWKLVWRDEFDGTQIDRSHWENDLGNGFYNYASNTWISGWGNGELQAYTRDVDNVFVKDGMLHIRALKESRDGCGYTSARLKTRKRDGTRLLAITYGRLEVRAKLPMGKGIWPALWMLSHDEKYGNWAASGEIDVLEVRGQEPNKVVSSLHFGSRWPANTHVSKDFMLPKNGSIIDFHVYAIEWEPGEIRWFVDNQESARQSFWWSCSMTDGTKGVKPRTEKDLNPWPAPFDQPFYLIMNVAVGGQFAGNPEDKTPFPAEMVVDYVRVYEKAGGYGRPEPRGEGKLPFLGP